MKKNLFQTTGGRLIIAIVLTMIVLACVTSFSCQLNPEGITLLRGSYECPKLLDFSIEGKNELQLTFSEEVTFTEMCIASVETAQEDFFDTDTDEDSYDYEQAYENEAAPEDNPEQETQPVTQPENVSGQEELPTDDSGQKSHPVAETDSEQNGQSVDVPGTIPEREEQPAADSEQNGQPADVPGTIPEREEQSAADSEQDGQSFDAPGTIPEQEEQSAADSEQENLPASESESEQETQHASEAGHFAAAEVSPGETTVSEKDDGSYQYNMKFPEDFDYGTSYIIYAVVEDENGNSLSFSADFTGYNDNLPDIVLSEVRTDYSKPKPEYIELFVLDDGNIGGMFLEVFYGTKKNTYAFPAVDVHQGDYLVLHMRKLSDDAADETDAIDVSTAADSCPSARDFWYPDEAKAIGKTGVILLRARENGPLLDALLYAESSKESWPNDTMKAAAQNAFISGIWPAGAEPSDAVCSDKCTATRTLSRQDYTKEGSFSWIVVATSCATPGTANSDKPAQ